MATGRVPTTANSPLTAKGDLFTYSTAPARLAVGTNGDSLVADSSATSGLRYSATPSASNPIINSAFQNWQRGTSFTGGTISYTADRWCAGTNGATTTITRQTTSDTTNLPNIQYAARLARNVSSTSTTRIEIANSFETVNSIPYAGKTVTLSFYARRGANYSSTSNIFTSQIYTGTGTDQNLLQTYTGATVAITADNTLTTTWQRFTVTGTLSASLTELSVYFYYTPTGTAGAADYVEVTGTQIDVGSVALPFRTYAGTMQGELAAAQRYYEKSYIQGTTAGTVTASGAFYGTRASGGFCISPTWKVTKRGTPTVTVYSTSTGTSARIRNRDTGTDEVATITDACDTAVYVSGTGGTAGVLYSLQWEASAEL